MERRDAVLSSLLQKVGGGRPCCRAGCELRSCSAVLGLESRLIETFGFFLELPALLDEQFKSCRIEIDIGDGGKEPFDDKHVNRGVCCPQAARLVGKEREALQSVQQIVLQRSNFRLLAADSRYFAGDPFCCLFTLMTKLVWPPYWWISGAV